METRGSKIIFVFFCLIVLGYISNITQKQNVAEIKKVEDIKLNTNIVDLTNYPLKKMSSFLRAIGRTESGNDYQAVNRFGYLGRYQFHPRTINGLGYDIDDSTFLNTPHLQDKVMMDYLRYNKKILSKYIRKWNGKIIGDKVVTESGILAAAHLVGPGGVMEYFDKGVDSSDANGTKVSNYLFRFSGYKIKI
jgi:hypothetical protein